MKISQALIDAATANKMSTVQVMVNRIPMQDVLTLWQALDNILLAIYRRSGTPVIGDKVKILDEADPYNKQVGEVTMWIRTNKRGDAALVLVVTFPDGTSGQYYPVQLTSDIKSVHIKVTK